MLYLLPSVLHPPAPRHFMLRLAALTLLALLAAGPAQAQWKWRDASGNVQYSDLPPPHGVPESDILQRPPSARKERIVIVPYGAASSAAAAAAASAASAPARAGTKAESDLQARQKAEQEALSKQKEEERRQAEQRQQNCRSAKDRLSLLEQGVRIKRTNERGEAIVLDDAQRSDELQRTRAIIASECR